MPVDVQRTVTLVEKDGTATILARNAQLVGVQAVKIIFADGSDRLVPANEKIESNTQVKLTCAGPRCAARHGKNYPVSLEFNEEHVKSDANALPDHYHRFIPIGDMENAAKDVVCSAQCAKDFYTYEYVAPLSPREKAEQMAQAVRDLPAPDSSTPLTPEAQALTQLPEKSEREAE